MKKLCLFFVMVGVSAACFAFGHNGSYMGGKRPLRHSMKGGRYEQYDNHHQGFERDMYQYMFDFLELSDSQTKKMQAIRKENRDEMFELRTNLQKTRIDQRVNLRNHNYNKAKSNAEKIAEIRSQMAKKRIEMQENCYNVLTKEQKAKL